MGEGAIEVEGLEKRFGDAGRARRSRLRRPAAVGLRPPRPQRRRQDHRRADPHDRLPPGRGSGFVLGHDVVRQARGPSSDRPGRPVRGGRPEPDRAGEPAADRTAGPVWTTSETMTTRGRAARSVRSRRRGRPARAHLLRGHAPPARRRRRARANGRRSCSWTSPRPDSTCTAGTRCGSMINELVAEGTTILLTTQYLEEADRLATTWRWSTGHGDRPRKPGRPEAQPREHGDRDRAGGRVSGRRRRRCWPGWSTPSPSVRAPRPAGLHRGPQLLVDVLRKLDNNGLSPASLAVTRTQPRRRVPRAHRPARGGGRRASDPSSRRPEAGDESPSSRR